MAMKTLSWLFAILALAAPLSADDYQYQYPTDPYNTTPQPQSTYRASGSGGGSHYYESLLSYGSIEARYNYNDFKHSNIDNSSGFGAMLRAPLFRPLFLNFGVNWLHGNSDHDGSFDLTTLTAGAGLYLPIIPRLHIFGELGVRYDIAGGSIDTINTDDFSIYGRPGVRFAATEKLELAASMLFSDTENFDKHIFELNGYFALLSVLDIGVGADFASDVNTYHAGLRLRW